MTLRDSRHGTRRLPAAGHSLTASCVHTAPDVFVDPESRTTDPDRAAVAARLRADPLARRPRHARELLSRLSSRLGVTSPERVLDTVCDAKAQLTLMIDYRAKDNVRPVHVCRRSAGRPVHRLTRPRPG